MLEDPSTNWMSAHTRGPDRGEDGALYKPPSHRVREGSGLTRVEQDAGGTSHTEDHRPGNQRHS